jgi:hypothetical protein
LAILIVKGQADKKKNKILDGDTKTAGEKRAVMTWAKRLKRAFNIDIEVCEACGGAVKIIAQNYQTIFLKKTTLHKSHVIANYMFHQSQIGS